ncbi:uncharacterized protein LOC116916547 [Daphnia magna]|nr:uncharacterized protein LOC116916547 [Daphnia magna]
MLEWIVEKNWETLNDSKTSKRQIWHEICSNLEEAGFCIRGVDKIQTCKNKWENLRKDYRNYISKFQQTGSGANDTQKKPKFFDSIEAVIGSSNHSFRPPYVSDSLYHNPHKFKVGEDREGEIKKTANDSNNSSLCGVALQEEPKPLGISCTEKNNSGMLSYISDDDIFLDSLDEASGSTQTKRKRPSKASKTDKVLEVFREMRDERSCRLLEEKKDKQKRHDERMEKTQQLIDVMKSLVPSSKKKKKKKKKCGNKKTFSSNNENFESKRKRSHSDSKSSSSSDECSSSSS